MSENAFEAIYGRAPAYVVRAPGRVNLIGEHIDYHDLPVMPFAIDRAIRVWAAPSADGRPWMRIATDSALGVAPSDRFTLEPTVPLLAPGDWRNYVRAAARSIVAEQLARRDRVVGIDALITSDLPMAAGLSSSSAIMIAVALAVANANDMVVNRVAMARQMAVAERATGTDSGGMDHAACLLARADNLCLVEFDPLSASHIPFPDDLRVIVAHSGVMAEKSGRVRDAYNERRRTGEEALRTVSEELGRAGASYADLLRDSSVAELLATASSSLDKRSLKRFRHVVTEHDRVRVARAVLESGDHALLGAQLYESHRSLRDDCGVSTPELDRLVDAVRAAGGLGARLTGAGFGGAVVALAHAARETDVQTALSEAVARDGGPVMRVRPSPGASVAEV